MLTQLKILLIAATALFYNQKTNAQPSYSMTIVFKLYDGKGHIVNKAKFAKEYALRGSYGRIMTISRSKKRPNNYHENHYDPEGQYFVLNISTVPSLYRLSICHGKDTMTIYLEGSAAVYCDSLVLHKGDFLLGYECDANPKYKELPSFMYQKFHLIKEADWECYRALFEKKKQDDPRLRSY